jgi:hypothetical protein
LISIDRGERRGKVGGGKKKNLPLGSTSLSVSRESNGRDLSGSTELLPETILVDVEREVSDPEGGSRRVRGSVGLVGLLLLSRGSDGSVVDSALSSVDHLARRVVALVGGLLRGELDVTDTYTTARRKEPTSQIDFET